MLDLSCNPIARDASSQRIAVLLLFMGFLSSSLTARAAVDPVCDADPVAPGAFVPLPPTCDADDGYYYAGEGAYLCPTAPEDFCEATDTYVCQGGVSLQIGNHNPTTGATPMLAEGAVECEGATWTSIEIHVSVRKDGNERVSVTRTASFPNPAYGITEVWTCPAVNPHNYRGHLQIWVDGAFGRQKLRNVYTNAFRGRCA